MDKKLNFEESLSRLEEITSLLEKGDMSLDESLKIFEEGIKLSRFCEKKLTEVEHKIEVLKSTEIPCESIVEKEEIVPKEETELTPSQSKKTSKPKKNSDDSNLLF